jgi:hypothetical protein
MKEIKLNKNKIALVDEDMFEYLNQWRWFCNSNGYAIRHKHIRISKNKYKNKIIRMHVLINETPNGLVTDHINRNKLDNRKENLRSVTKSLNAINSKLNNNNRSGVNGVYFDNFTGKWRAELKKDYRKYTLGRYKLLKDALEARKCAERLYYGI